jgi:membrane protease YdiL (CAAX protease family)
MGRIISYNRREIASKRLKFLFYEVVPIYLLIFILLILEWILLPLIVNQTTELFGMLFYIIRALVIVLAIIFVLFISNKYIIKHSQWVEKEFAPYIIYLKLYSMTRKNYKYQFLYGFLLFFLILIPLDFLISITLPNTISPIAYSLVFKKENAFLLINNITQFLLFSVVIQFSISFSEETIFRGLIAKRGSKHFNKVSAVMISTFYFTFIEFFLNPVIFTTSYYFGVIVFIKAFIVGLVLSLTIIRRRWLFPLIIAKTFDSIISSVIIWDFFRGGNFIQLLVFIYCPLLLISLILLILQRSRVKESLQIGIKMIKSYYKNNIKLEESSGDKLFRILFDIFLAFLLFLFGILISV